MTFDAAVQEHVSIIIVLVLETSVWGSTWPTYRQDVCRIVGALSVLESTNSHPVPMGV